MQCMAGAVHDPETTQSARRQDDACLNANRRALRELI